MANPFIPLTKAAIKANMTKNEGLIFMVLSMQTIGYRKATDNLTDKRLAQLTGIRRDHLRPSLESFLEYGLFQRIEHKHYDYQYRLCDEFLDEGRATIIYPPSLPTPAASPEMGEEQQTSVNLPDAGANHPPRSVSCPDAGENNPPRSVNLPDAGEHTTENLYIKKQQQTKPKKNNSQKQQTKPKKNKPQKQQTKPKKNNLQKQQTKPKKNKLQKQQTEPKKNIIQEQPQASVTISMTGLESLPEHFVINSSQPVRIEFSAKKSDKKAEIMPEAQTEIVPKTEPIAMIDQPIKLNETREITEPVAMIIDQPIELNELSDTREITEPVAMIIDQPIELNELSDTREITAKTLADSEPTELDAPRDIVANTLMDKDESIGEPSSLCTKTLMDKDESICLPTRELNETSDLVANTISNPIVQVSEPETKMNPIADLAVSVAATLIQATKETPVVVIEKSDKKPLLVPKVVGEENYNACNRYFEPLTDAQKQDVLSVFFYNLKLGNIRNKASYFIGLAQKVIRKNLTVPPEAKTKSAAQQGSLNYEEQLIQKEANKKNNDYLAAWGDYTWVQRQAKLLNKSEQETAEMMGLEKSYAMFSKSEKVTQTQQDKTEDAVTCVT